MTPEVTRRGLLKTAGIAGAGLGLGAGGFVLGRESAEDQFRSTGTVPFWGPQQAGITTAAQDRLHFAGFDLTTDSPAELRDLLVAWTEAAARMTAGEPAGDRNDEPLLPAEDTGEAVGHLPSRLTITFGFGPCSSTVASALRRSAPAPCVRCPLSRPRRSTRRARAGTCACRPAPMTLRSPFTRFAT